MRSPRLVYLRWNDGDDARDRAHRAVVHVGEVGDRALGQSAQRALDAHQRVVAHVEPEHVLLGARAARPCRTRRRGSRGGRRSTGDASSAAPPPRSNRLIVPCVALAPAAQARVDDRLEHVEQTLARVTERVEATAVDQRLDRALVEHARIDAVAEVVEVDERAAVARALRSTARTHPRRRCAPRRARSGWRDPSHEKSLNDAFTSGTSTGMSSWRHSLR